MIRDAARKYTDAELKKLEKEIHSAYKKAYSELNKKWRDAIATAKAKEKPYLDAYLEAKKTGDKAAIRKAGRELAHIQRQNTLESEHYKRTRDGIARQLAELDKTAYTLANGKLNAIYAVNFNQLAGSLPMGYAYGLIAPETVRNLLTKQLNLVKATAWNVQLMNQEVLQGILQGESMGKIAKRFARVLGMNEQSAIRNARTAVTYAENQGRLDSMKEAQDEGIILAKEWISTDDNRTRDSHKDIGGVGGDVVGIDEEFANGLQCPGDPRGDGAEIYNCRCALGEIIIGFRRADGSIEYTVEGEQYRGRFE